MTEIIDNIVRGVPMRFSGRTRALRLCARMNYETEVLDFIDSMAPGSVLFDLGACEGRFALYAALKGVKCYAFEPEPLNFETMMENISLNGPLANENLVPLNFAVGARPEVSAIRIAQPWAGGHQRVLASAPNRADLAFEFVTETLVNVVALDDFKRDNRLPDPDFLKVDIDGSELPFLEGASQTLANTQVKAILFELCERDESYGAVSKALFANTFELHSRHEVEPALFNVWFHRPRA